MADSTSTNVVITLSKSRGFIIGLRSFVFPVNILNGLLIDPIFDYVIEKCMLKNDLIGNFLNCDRRTGILSIL